MSKYPEEIDEHLSVIENDISIITSGYVNDIRHAIINIQRELGENPSSTSGTVKSRLDQLALVIDEVVGFLTLSASNILVNDADGYFDGINIEAVVAEIGLLINHFPASLVQSVGLETDLNSALISANNDIGNLIAGDIIVADVDGYFNSDNVEGVLREVKLETMGRKINYISGHIELPTNKEYVLISKTPFGGTVVSITTQCSTGSATVVLKINETLLAGTTAATTKTILTFETANVFIPGDLIRLLVSDATDLSNVRYSVNYTRD